MTAGEVTVHRSNDAKALRLGEKWANATTLLGFPDDACAELSMVAEEKKDERGENGARPEVQ